MDKLKPLDRDLEFFFPSERGQFPVLSPEAISKHGNVENMVPGDMRFVRSNTIVFDQYSRSVMVDTGDFIPEEQDGMIYKMAVRKIDFATEDDTALQGYLVDARHGLFTLTDRQPDLDGKAPEFASKFRPVAPLAVVYRNRLTGQEEATGVPGTESSLLQLMEEVDAILAAQVKPVAEVESKPRDEGILRQASAIAGKALEACIPLFKSVVADQTISHESANRLVQKLKNG